MKNRLRTGVRMPEHLKDKLKSIADYEGISVNALILEACKKLVGEKQEKLTTRKGDKNGG